jgi:hypothetical protein
MMRTNQIRVLDRECDQDLFESVTEEEIIYLWRSIKGRGLSEDEAWQAVVTGIALDMAFAKTKSCNRFEH